jgi:ADP-heptose:LPS heptosyltransferase
MHLRPPYHDIAVTWIDAARDFRLMREDYPFGTGGELEAHRRVVSAALGREVAREEILPSFAHFPVSDDGRLLVYPLSQDGTKNVPVERIVKILRLWRARSRAPIVLGGSPRDTATLERYAAAARAAGIDPVTVEAPPGVVAFVEHAAAASAVFSADSAAAHVGAACDKPTVVLMMDRAWHGISLPSPRSGRQQVFLADEADDATVAAALPPV